MKLSLMLALAMSPVLAQAWDLEGTWVSSKTDQVGSAPATYAWKSRVVVGMRGYSQEITNWDMRVTPIRELRARVEGRYNPTFLGATGPYSRRYQLQVLVNTATVETNDALWANQTRLCGITGWIPNLARDVRGTSCDIGKVVYQTADYYVTGPGTEQVQMSVLMPNPGGTYMGNWYSRE